MGRNCRMGSALNTRLVASCGREALRLTPRCGADKAHERDRGALVAESTLNQPPRSRSDS